jgi:hypothetical protein
MRYSNVGRIYLPAPPTVQQWRANTVDKTTDQELLNSLIEQYRNRLGNLSWFMKYLNEPVAPQAAKLIVV